MFYSRRPRDASTSRPRGLPWPRLPPRAGETAPPAKPIGIRPKRAPERTKGLRQEVCARSNVSGSPVREVSQSWSEKSRHVYECSHRTRERMREFQPWSWEFGKVGKSHAPSVAIHEFYGLLLATSGTSGTHSPNSPGACICRLSRSEAKLFSSLSAARRRYIA